MKVFVVTEAEPLCAEVYKGVFPSQKRAEKFIKSLYPNARLDDSLSISYICKHKPTGHITFMYIHPEEI